MRLLITGGAGFVGSTLALSWRRDHPGDDVIAVDNLQKSDSALRVARLEAGGVRFVHADATTLTEIDGLGSVQWVIDCAADPSVKTGYDGGVARLIQTHLGATAGSLQLCQREGAGILFLSTSRVHPIAQLRALPLEEASSRLQLTAGRAGSGWSPSGIGPGFPLDGYRSPYGASKLAAELMIEEYAEAHDIPAVVNRCGVISGPWQMGSVDQGFIALWAARHLWGESLRYMGFGGTGLQVRDILHVADLYDLIVRQIQTVQSGFQVQYVGGGTARTTSLRELTEACQQRAGRSIEILPHPETHRSDVPYYVTDLSAVHHATGWAPTRSHAELLDDVFGWLRAERHIIESRFQ
jgi:CDP-paratose 2-epimerase